FLSLSPPQPQARAAQIRVVSRSARCRIAVRPRAAASGRGRGRPPLRMKRAGRNRSRPALALRVKQACAAGLLLGVLGGFGLVLGGLVLLAAADVAAEDADQTERQDESEQLLHSETFLS